MTDHPDATSNPDLGSGISADESRTANGQRVVDPGVGRHGGDEPMTGPQRVYLKALCRETGEAFDEGLSTSEAIRRIEELQARLPGRGLS